MNSPYPGMELSGVQRGKLLLFKHLNAEGHFEVFKTVLLSTFRFTESSSGRSLKRLFESGNVHNLFSCGTKIEAEEEDSKFRAEAPPTSASECPSLQSPHLP